jgi:hypothetical protein
MTERQAFIGFAIVIVVMTFVLVGGLVSLGADSATLDLAYLLILCAAGFGVGGIVTHYHR